MNESVFFYILYTIQLLTMGTVHMKMCQDIGKIQQAVAITEIYSFNCDLILKNLNSNKH